MESSNEVQELRNKLRMMKFPQDEILNTVRKQQKAISKQKQANETVKSAIVEYEAQIASIDKSNIDHDTNEELNHLKALEKNLTNKLGVLSADFAAEDQKRRSLEEEVSKARSKVGGMFAQTREHEEMQARVRTMENRLDKALVRYNQDLYKLAEKRSQLDELRKDRFIFREVIKNATMEEKALGEHMSKLIAESNDAYSERDRMKMELNDLRASEKADLDNFDKEMERLNQTIEGQRIASNRPHDPQQSVPSISSQVGSSSEMPDEITKMTDEYNARISETLNKLNMKSSAELFEEAEKLERENFSLFSFVVEHGANRTKLQEEIDALEMQYNALVEQHRSTEESQAADLAILTEEINDYQSRLDEIESQRQASEAEFQEVYKEVEDLFNMLGCSWDDAPDEKTVVTSVNAMFCLTSIETAIAAIMDEVGQKAKNQYELAPQDVKQQDDRVAEASMRSHTKILDKALTDKIVSESARPLSVEEIRVKISSDLLN